MKVKGFLDRKLFQLVGPLILRRLGTALAVYLASKGAPVETVDQLLAAIGVVFGLGFDLALGWIDKRKTENAAIRSVLDALPEASADSVFHKAGPLFAVLGDRNGIYSEGRR